MRCQICSEEVRDEEQAQQWGPELANATCVTAYNFGKADERERVNALLAAIRAHWIKANGADSISVGALDVISEVISDGSYVESGHNTNGNRPAPEGETR